MEASKAEEQVKEESNMAADWAAEVDDSSQTSRHKGKKERWFDRDRAGFFFRFFFFFAQGSWGHARLESMYSPSFHACVRCALAFALSLKCIIAFKHGSCVLPLPQ
eukprot:519694-Amphidinium_carterae.1